MTFDLSIFLTATAAVTCAVLISACDNYDPCEDKACGDACLICDPDDADCVEPAGSKFCNNQDVCATIPVPSSCG